MVKIGLVARADNSGLGIQTLEFYRHMEPAKTMVVDISKLNGNPVHPERYPDGVFIRGFPTPNDINNFLEGLDVVFIAEAPYNYWLYERARELGVKTAVQYNYEFFDWFANPHYPKPDMLIAPSKWHYVDVQNWCDENNVKHIQLHCPVDRNKLRFREIRKAKTFLHAAGKSAAHDRNGTKIVIEASRYLRSDAQILIHFQGEQGLGHQTTHTIEDYRQHIYRRGEPSRIEIVEREFMYYQDVYSRGDVLLLPRRYGGNCLPMNEALSIGMPVIMTDISPNDSSLPAQWLIPAKKIDEFQPRTTIDIYGADPADLAKKIDEFSNMTTDEMIGSNKLANKLAGTIDWLYMKARYEQVLESLCTQS